MKYYIGIDLGGTNVRVAKIDKNGKIIQDLNGPSHGSTGPRELVKDTIIAMLEKIDNLKECEGIGMAIPGPVNVYNRTMPIANNLPGFEDYPLADLIEEHFNMKVYLDNDANMAGLAEATLGAGKGYPIVYYITHSTGVGGGLVIDGKVISGQNGFAGEIGNVIVKDGCQRYSKYLCAGSIESESSGTGLERKTKAIFGENTDAIYLFEQYKNGNVEAIKIVEEMADNMGRLLATISQIIDPHVFVIGGGVAKRSEYYWSAMENSYHKYFNGVKPALIKKAQLKEPGVLGAAMLVRENEK